MRVSSPIILALLTMIFAILLPIGVIEITLYSFCGTCGGLLYYTNSIDLSISRLDSLSIMYPGIAFVFILWIIVSLIQTTNLLIFSRGLFSPIIAWFVFLPALIAQLYIPSLVPNLFLQISAMVSQVSQPNIICSLPAALGLVLVSLRNRQKKREKQLVRIGLS